MKRLNFHRLYVESVTYIEYPASNPNLARHSRMSACLSYRSHHMTWDLPGPEPIGNVWAWRRLPLEGFTCTNMEELKR